MSGPKRARGKQVAGRIRTAFDQALDRLASGEHGTTIELRDIWMEMITQDPFKALETLARFVPKEHLIEIDQEIKLISGEPVTAEQWEAANVIGEPVETDTAH